MNKKLRRFLVVTGSVLIGLVGLLFVLPIVFEEDLKLILKEELNRQLVADIDFEDLNLSFIRNFPDATIEVTDFSIVNRAPFAGDTLIAGSSFSGTLNLMSIFRGDEYQIKAVSATNPRVFVQVLPDGTASYDITIPSEESTDSVSSGSFGITLEKYALTNADIQYIDQTLPMSVTMKGLNHSGTGNFSEIDYLLKTLTVIDELSLEYDGIRYLNDLAVTAKADLDIHNGEELLITLKDNQVELNHFPLTADGTVTLAGEDIRTELTFDCTGSDFGTLLSLVPEFFKTDLAGFQAEGAFDFSGSLNGIYNETSIPGYTLDLTVEDGLIAYPDLPEQIRDIQLNLHLNNPDGTEEAFSLDLPTLSANLGAYPMTVFLHLKNLTRPSIQGAANTNLMLEDLAKIYPIEGIELAGKFALDASFDGIYDEDAGTFPEVSAVMNLEDGMVHSLEYDTRLTDFRFSGSLKDVSSNISEAVLAIPSFHFLLDGDPLDGALTVTNFDDPRYELTASGGLDLGKLYSLYPIDSMELEGKLTINDLYAAGTYSDVEAEAYNKLDNRGSAVIENLYYRDLWYTQPGVRLDQGEVTFSPERLSFQNVSGKLGSSEFRGSGSLTNYLEYILMGSEELQGALAVTSPSFDANEWLAAMEDESSPATEGSETSEDAIEVYPIPAGYDLIMDLNVAELLYDDLTLKNVSGDLEIKEQQMFMEDVGFDMLGAKVTMGGVYDTRSKDRAGYDFFLNVSDLLVKEAFKHFAVVKSYAPVAQFLEGTCNLEVGLKGGLKPDFSPILEDVNAFGLFELLEGGLANTPLTNSLASNTNIGALKSWSLNDVKGIFRIIDGTLTFDPIDLKLGDITLTLDGAQNLGGGIRYNVMLDAPQNSLSAAAFQSLGNLTGGALNPGERVQVNLLVTGTHGDPKVSGAGGGTVATLKDQATTALEGEIQNRTGSDLSLNEDSLKSQAAKARQQVEDSLRAVAAQAGQQVKDSLNTVADSLKSQAQQALEEELRKHAGEDVTEKLKDLKKRIRLPRRGG